MKAVNKVILVGNVGTEPEIRYANSGMPVASFSLATNKKPKDKPEVTQWHNIVAFGKTAELIQQYVNKGSKLYIDGELQYDQYEKDGQKRTATKIIINDVSFLSSGSNQPASQPKAKPAVDFLDDDSPF